MNPTERDESSSQGPLPYVPPSVESLKLSIDAAESLT